MESTRFLRRSVPFRLGFTQEKQEKQETQETQDRQGPQRSFHHQVGGRPGHSCVSCVNRGPDRGLLRLLCKPGVWR